MKLLWTIAMYLVLFGVSFTGVVILQKVAFSIGQNGVELPIR